MHHFYQGFVNVDKNGIALRDKYGNIFRVVFVRLKYVEYVFYMGLYIFMTCVRIDKEKLFSFISYCILYFNHSSVTCAQIFLLTNHSLLNPLLPDRFLHNSHSPNRSFSLTTISPIDAFLSPTWYLVFYCPTCSVIA